MKTNEEHAQYLGGEDWIPPSESKPDGLDFTMRCIGVAFLITAAAACVGAIVLLLGLAAK